MTKKSQAKALIDNHCPMQGFQFFKIRECRSTSQCERPLNLHTRETSDRNYSFTIDSLVKGTMITSASWTKVGEVVVGATSFGWITPCI